jgi:heme/copper-type cytochrome/quinol oxidase subunit 3
MEATPNVPATPNAPGSAPVPTLEPEPREWQPRVTWLGARLFAASTAFFFLAFVFAYFYLRSLDTNGSWKIGKHVNPSTGLGIAIVVTVVLSALLARATVSRPETPAAAGWVAIALGLAAVVLQCIEYATLGFGPANGGYASVFVGWTSLYAVAVLGTMYWLETQFATAARARREGVTNNEELLRAGLEGATFYWAFLAGIGVLAWVILYLL